MYVKSYLSSILCIFDICDHVYVRFMMDCLFISFIADRLILDKPQFMLIIAWPNIMTALLKQLPAAERPLFILIYKIIEIATEARG